MIKNPPSPFKSNNHSIKLSKSIIIICLALFFIFIAYYLYNYSFLSPRNYAQELALPIEQSLINAGAIKKCSQGDNGRGLDNNTPRYSASFEISGEKHQAVSALYNLAEQNGYSLKHAAPDDRGSGLLGLYSVSASDLNSWYFDETHKKSPYFDLNDGFVRFTAAVKGGGEEFVCDKQKSTIPSNKSVISFNLELPTFK